MKYFDSRTHPEWEHKGSKLTRKTESESVVFDNTKTILRCLNWNLFFSVYVYAFACKYRKNYRKPLTAAAVDYF